MFDKSTLAYGAISGLFFALPAAILQRTIFEDSFMSLLMLGVIFFAGALAGFGAGRVATSHAVPHGAGAGVITFLGAQIVFSIASASVPNPIGVIGFALLFASLGIMGAYVALAQKGKSA